MKTCIVMAVPVLGWRWPMRPRRHRCKARSPASPTATACGWSRPPPGAPVELRLEGIDAPEICQAWGPQAKQALAELVLGQQVSVKTVGRDTHGRTLGTVFLGGQNINKTLVQEGHAWSTRYKYDRGLYVADERMAQGVEPRPQPRRRRGHATRLPPAQRALPRADGSRARARSTAPAPAPAAAPLPRLAPVAAAPAPLAGGWRCDGRTRCSQMTSCAEATWFLQNCPGAEMDGNRDGVPCERQWCKP